MFVLVFLLFNANIEMRSYGFKCICILHGHNKIRLIFCVKCVCWWQQTFMWNLLLILGRRFKSFSYLDFNFEKNDGMFWLNFKYPKVILSTIMENYLYNQNDSGFYKLYNNNKIESQ